jgi:acyl-CoA synthetase (AMP-forming)/AMP-acid ligase II
MKQVTLVDLLRRRAMEHPNRIAYRFLSEAASSESTLTYAELDAQARQIATRLRREGATGNRVVLIGVTGLEFVIPFFGILYAGAVAVPLSPPRLSKPSLRTYGVLRDAGAALVISPPNFESRLSRIGETIPELGGLTLLVSDQLTTACEAPPFVDAASPTVAAILQYTSGSTSAPKGVELTHENLVQNAAQIAAAMELGPESVGINWAPLYHDMGLMNGVIEPLFSGYPVTLMSPAAFLARPLSWLRAITRYSATMTGGPNFAYELCVEKIPAEQLQGLDLGSWRDAFCGAEPIRANTLERFADRFRPYGFNYRSFFPCYGLAETTVLVSGGPTQSEPRVLSLRKGSVELGKRVVPATGDDRGYRLVSSGPPLPGQTIAIVDPFTRERCPDGQVGEIWASGPSIGQRYWNLTDETNDTFNAHIEATQEGPFLRTGDIGFCDCGELYITGRLKDLIIVHGLNHYPQDIELSVEDAHPALRSGAGAAFAVENNGEEQLVVVQELKRSWQGDPAKVADAILRNVAEQHGIPPAAIVLIKSNTIQKTTSGKIQRRAVRAAYLAGELDTVISWSGLDTLAHDRALTSPESPLQALLVRLWSDILEVQGIGIDDNFFELGGNSLSIQRVMARVEEQCQTRLSVRSIFEAPTIREFSVLIEAFLESTACASGSPSPFRDSALRPRP